MGRARKSVSTAFAFLGVDETGVPQLGQDMIEELFRNRIGFGDVRHLSEPIRGQSGQMDHGLEAVLPLLREHNLILTFGRKPCSARWSARRAATPRPSAYRTRPENTTTLPRPLDLSIIRSLPPSSGARSPARSCGANSPTSTPDGKERRQRAHKRNRIDRSSPQDIEGFPAGCVDGRSALAGI